MKKYFVKISKCDKVLGYYQEKNLEEAKKIKEEMRNEYKGYNVYIDIQNDKAIDLIKS